MTPEQLDAQIELTERKIASLTRYWRHAIPTVEPPDRLQFLLWLRSYDHAFDTVHYAIGETAKKCERLGGSMSQNHAIRFASKCAITFRKARALPQLPSDRFIPRVAPSYEENVRSL